jgi:hypothetical protein
MMLNKGRRAAVLLAALALACLAADAAPKATSYVTPNPVLFLTGQESYEAGGKRFTRYMYAVLNSSEYPATMFAAAPDLPPCGKNTKSSRTWVDIYDSAGKRLYGFCALAKPDDLNNLWFALEEGVVPPSWIYIELNDRASNTKYKSNLAETTQ